MHLDIFAVVTLVLAMAAALVWILQKLGQSPVVAYLLLGVIAGPSVLDLVRTGEGGEHLSEAGVVLLLFFVGLELHVSALRVMARLAGLGALLQVGLTTAALAGAARLAGFTAAESLVAGFAAALSSTAIVCKAFEDRQEADSATARSCVAILIGQDLIALLALAVMPLLCGVKVEDRFGLGAAGSFAAMLAALPVLFFGARAVLPRVFRRAAIARNQEAFGLCSIAACLAVAVLAHLAGASMALGAFLGGLVFAGTPYAHQIRADLAVLRNLALGFFFVTVGTLIDLAFALAHLPLLGAALAVIVLGKTVLAALAMRILRSPWGLSAGVGLALSQIGEFALVLANLARPSGIMGDAAYQTLVSLTGLSMLVAPLLVAASRPFGHAVARLAHDAPAARRPAAPPAAVEERDVAAPENPIVRAVVVGYGPVGKAVCRILIRLGVEPCVVDLSFETINRLHAIGREGVYGDAGRREVLVAAGVTEARFLVVTLPDFATRASIITSARALNPGIAIVTRARYMTEKPRLEAAGAEQVAIEEVEVAAALARRLLRLLEVPDASIEEEVARVQDEIATRTGFTTIMKRPVDLLDSRAPLAPRRPQD